MNKKRQRHRGDASDDFFDHFDRKIDVTKFSKTPNERVNPSHKNLLGPWERIPVTAKATLLQSRGQSVELGLSKQIVRDFLEHKSGVGIKVHCSTWTNLASAEKCWCRCHPDIGDEGGETWEGGIGNETYSAVGIFVILVKM